MLHRETCAKPDNYITHSTASPSQASTSQEQVESYMATINGGGDPVTALGYRATSSSQSIAKRVSQVQQAMDTNSARLGNPDSSQ